MSYYGPLDVRCPDCHAPPGTRCWWRDRTGPRFRQPHAARVLAARDASRARAHSRQDSQQPSS